MAHLAAPKGTRSGAAMSTAPSRAGPSAVPSSSPDFSLGTSPSARREAAVVSPPSAPSRNRCGVCCATISDAELAECVPPRALAGQPASPLGLKGIVRMFDREYHASHFVCSVCFKSLLDCEPVLHDSRLFCHDHFSAKVFRFCAACSLSISGGYTFALDKYWHGHCFACVTCQAPLSGAFHERGGQPYCEAHYREKFGLVCSGCKEPITCEYVVAMDRPWHLDHFRCVHCTGSLAAGFVPQADGQPACATCFSRGGASDVAASRASAVAAATAVRGATSTGVACGPGARAAGHVSTSGMPSGLTGGDTAAAIAPKYRDARAEGQRVDASAYQRGRRVTLGELEEALRLRALAFVNHLRAHAYGALTEALVEIVRELRAIFTELQVLEAFDVSELRTAASSLVAATKAIVSAADARVSVEVPVAESLLAAVVVALRNLSATVSRTLVLFKQMRALYRRSGAFFEPQADISSAAPGSLTAPSLVTLTGPSHAGALPLASPSASSTPRATATVPARASTPAARAPTGLPSAATADVSGGAPAGSPATTRDAARAPTGRAPGSGVMGSTRASGPARTSHESTHAPARETLAGIAQALLGESAEAAISTVDSSALQRADVVSEIVLTEEAYVTDLTVLVMDFLMPLRFLGASLLATQSREVIFCNAEALLSFHLPLLADIKRARGMAGADPDASVTSVVATFVERVSALVPLYQTYGINTSMALHELSRVLDAREGQRLDDFLRANYARLGWGAGGAPLDGDGSARGLGALLVLPHRRVVKLTLLLKSLARVCVPGTELASQVALLVGELRALAFHVHEQRSLMDNFHELLTVQQSVKGLASLPLNVNRVVLRRGPLEVEHGRETMYVVLFDDLVCWAKPTSREGEFRLVGSTPLGATTFFVDQTDDQSRGFTLMLADGSERRFVAGSVRERTEWTVAVCDALAAYHSKAIAAQVEAENDVIASLGFSL